MVPTHVSKQKGKKLVRPMNGKSIKKKLKVNDINHQLVSEPSP